MARNADWSDEENSALVNAYLDMLRHEFRDESFVKTEVNRRLQADLKRGRGSIEFKLANVSAALREMSFPFVKVISPTRTSRPLYGTRFASRSCSSKIRQISPLRV